MLNKKLLGSVSSLPQDDNFENVTLLLNGDGTNGAQNNTFVDSSTNNFTITRNGNTTQGSFSPYGTLWSNYFDGSGDNLSLSGTAVGTSNATVEFFIFPTDSSTTYRAVFDSRSTAGTNTGFGIFQYGLTIEVYGNGLKVSSAASALNINAWNHVALTRSSGTCQLYINGVASGSSGSYSDNLTSTSVRIGDTPSGTAFPYLGYISNLRVVIGSVLYTGSYTVPTAPLTAISGTSLLTCQSNRFVDNSSNNRAITVNGNTSVQRFSPFEPTEPYSTSVIGGSGYFDGSGDYLQLTNSISMSSAFTIEGWFYPTSLSFANFGQGTIIASNKNSSSGVNGIGLNLYDTGELYFFLGNGAAIVANPTIAINQWHHFAWVYDGSTISAYLNGTRVGTRSGATNNSNNITTIGGAVSGVNWDANLWFIGYISDIRATNTQVYSGTTYTVPTAQLTAISGTNFLTRMTNAGIPDLAMQNNLESVGNAQVSTSVKKFGTGSMSFNGTNSALTAPQNNVLGFGTGNFTVEFWMYPNSTPAGARTLIDFRNPTNNNDTKLSIWITSGNKFIVYSATTAKLNDVGSWSATQWAHIALCKSGSTTNLYVNGTSVGSFSDTTNYGATSFVTVASDNGQSGYWFNGYIDDLRITKGVARYTANFTAPASALPTY